MLNDGLKRVGVNPYAQGVMNDVYIETTGARAGVNQDADRIRKLGHFVALLVWGADTTLDCR